MSSQAQIVPSTRRTLAWHAKWLFASFAAALAMFLLAVLVSLPFVGWRLLDSYLEHRSIMFFLVVALAPLTYRWLK